ncbi:hypothetical protein BKA63DRAFT_494865 [Paraphoma chrysanthemicola]|nr:hypothetical protein BKA63DRAFT_494865 [Paraphoma chrysanthemicola]
MSLLNSVCDTCKSRKVKCDRNDPCGNCIDGNIKCVRTSTALRQVRSSSKRRKETDTAPAPKVSRRHELQASPSSSTPSPSMPQSPSVSEAQDFIRQELKSVKNMPADRLAVLKSAMSFVNHLSQAAKPTESLFASSTRVLDVLEGISYPSIELLFWMLRELKGKKMGSHVLDYFKHVSPSSLRDMGLALINKAGSAETLLLYSICVNSAAFKFINTVLSENTIEEVAAGMRASAAKHLKSVKLAIGRIHLLSAPSLVFLQALLCSAFIAQGSGDLPDCWTFITAACKVCEDLSLESQVKSGRTNTEADEEVYYCYIWCHILDKSYSMMQGRTRYLLDYAGLDAALSSPLNMSLSSLLSTYLHFVPIQAMFISELHPEKISNNKSLLARVEVVVRDLLEKLESVHARITELYGPSDVWGGLHIGSELNTIQFSYHSLRTSILRSRQICLPGKPHIDNDCLQSARLSMITLRAIQEESVTITDVRAHVSYMHWTILYHPLTPFFVLFCHVVATSSEQDFQLLTVIANQLDRLADFSPPIAKLQTLCKSFIQLCDGLILKARSSTSPNDGSRERAITSAPAMEATTTQQLPTDLTHVQTGASNDASELVAQQGLVVPSYHDAQAAFPYDNGSGMIDPGWGLFDTQPTLDWLEADFSFFDSHQ